MTRKHPRSRSTIGGKIKWAAANEEPLDEIGLSVPSLVKAVNVRRAQFCGLDGTPLAVLNGKAVWRVVESAVEAGQMENRRSNVFLKP